jgi:cytidine deaminase
MKELPYRDLLQIANRVSNDAYAPYTKEVNGVALLTKEGKIFTGFTIQTANWSSSICAAQSAIIRAVNEGHRHFIAIAISGTGGDINYLCGGCRQLLAEFGKDVMVISEINPEKVMTLHELLPFSFLL